MRPLVGEPCEKSVEISLSFSVILFFFFPLSTDLLIHLSQNVTTTTQKGRVEAAESLRLDEVERNADAVSLARLFEEISQHPPFKKYLVYLLSEFVKMSVSGGMNMNYGSHNNQRTRKNPRRLPRETRQVLLPGIYALLDSCSQYELNLLNVGLDSSERAVFKSIYSDFQRDYKFKGKV
jgi:hypothetical protein